MNHLFFFSKHRKPGQQLALLPVFLSLIFLLSQLSPPISYSQGGDGTGPGGVGSTDGTSTLEVWYQSDGPVYSDDTCSTPQTSDNGTVACWPDQSGNDLMGFGFEAKSSVAGRQPTLQTGSGETWNGHPVVFFDGSDILVTTENVILGPLTVFILYNASEIGYLYVHSPRAGPTANDGSYIYSDVVASYSVTRSGVEGYEDLASGWGINIVPRIVTHHYNGSIATHNLFINGSLQAPLATDPNSPGTGAISDVFSIGDRQSASVVPDTPITGNFAEVIAYNEYLNSAQRTLVENYLQAKFNDSVTNNITISNDVYDGDTTANGNFDMDVAGIGQEADGSHTEAHSAGMIVQNVAGATGFLQDDGDYLLFGHRTLTSGNTTSDIPTTGVWLGAPAPQRWTRHWEISVTDVVGTANGMVNIIFDFSEGGMDPTEPPAGPASNYRLIGRSGPSGQFADVMGATSVSTDQVIFSGVDVSLLGSNFTLGTLNADVSPTVVEMRNAAATTPLSAAPFLISLALLLLGSVTLIRMRRGRSA